MGTTTNSFKMSLVSRIYQSIFRRSSTFTLAILVGALTFERVFDQGSDYIFETINRGKLWDHMKHKYEGDGDDDDGDDDDDE